MNITLDAHLLRPLLQAVLPVASKDKTRTNINQVLIRIKDGTLILAATDGRRLHRGLCVEWRLDPSEDPADEDVLISTGSAAALLTALKAACRGTKNSLVVPVTLTAASVTLPTGTVFLTQGATGTFPPIDKVIPLLREEGTCLLVVGINPTYLAEAAEACNVLAVTYRPDGLTLRIELGATATDPARFAAVGTVGNRDQLCEILCIVMPCRL
jgi:hypothetical protein